MQLDRARDTIAVMDTDTAEIIPTYVFLATPPYSGCNRSANGTLAPSRNLRDIRCHPKNLISIFQKNKWGVVVEDQ